MKESKNNTMTRRGFTLIELLIVVAIIGIIAAIAIPNLLVAIQKSKQKATMVELKTFGTAIELYTTDNFQAPVDLTFGNSVNESFYMKNPPATDSWGNSWQYTRSNSKLQVYSIASSGRDGTFEGYDQKGVYVVNSIQGFGKDIIFSAGLFVYGPRIR